MKRLITSESVSFAHPDKIADQISDGILDAFLEKDPNCKVAVETMVKDNTVVLGGEVSSKESIDYDKVVREIVKTFGYTLEHGFHQDSLTIINLIGKQSKEINLAVELEDTVTAGDQGFMVGYATNETPTYMPLGMYISKKLVDYVSVFDHRFGPDTKAQVTIEEDSEDNSKRVHTILVSTMHDKSIELDEVITTIKNDIKMNLIGFDKDIHSLIDENTNIIINPAGQWNIGGPVSDCGLTGRKIVVDQYGPYCPVGGGAYSGKDANSKCDRSGAYLARYLAKNIVSTGLVNECKVEISYMIGISEPSSLNIDTFGQYDDEKLIKIIKSIIEMSPSSVSDKFDLKNPIGWSYLETAKGHYGNDIFPWEQLDMVDKIKSRV